MIFTRRIYAIAAVVIVAIGVAATFASSIAVADFKVESFTGLSANADGTSYDQAAGHPYEATTTVQFQNPFLELGAGSVKEVQVDLPPGFIGNPSITSARCTSAQLAEGFSGDCPVSSQVGVGRIFTAFNNNPVVAVYNLARGPGEPARFGFRVFAQPAFLIPSLRTGGDYGLTVHSPEIAALLPITGVSISLWGVPADPSHDADRGTPVQAGVGGSDQYCAGTSDPGCSIPAGYSPQAFLTMPGNCSAGATPTVLRARSWQEPDQVVTSSFSTDTNGNPTEVAGCEEVPFDPSISVQPTSHQADSPTGLVVDLSIPQETLASPSGLAQASLKRAVVTLPEGISVNPASADGQGACGPAQIDIGSPSGDECPDSSKIGTVEVRTPLLEEPLPGSVYLARQKENPFNSLLAIYIAINDPNTGLVVKLPGSVSLDPGTGRLQASFDDNPQIPFSSFELRFFDGPRAPLVTPPTCGQYASLGQFSSWSAADPDNPTPAETVTKTSTFNITSGPNGSPCPTPGQFDPAFEAGTTTPIAGAYSPLVVNASRPDGSQGLQGLSVTLPEGLTGKLAGVQTCSDAALKAAASKSGEEELAAPGCAAASKVGTVDVAAGAGSTPFHVTGSAYLAGPYKSAPLSLAVITPAVAGPFDLGTVVTRAAAQIDPVTTQIRVASDPIPSILEGIPLKVRSVSVNTDRPQFTLNPTNCDPMSLDGTLFGSSASKVVSSRFQVGACKALSFAPKLSLSLKGPTHRRAHPGLKAVLTAKPGEANIARAQVKLPKAAFIDNAHIGTPCTRPAFASHACPEASRVGRVSATTPILDYALKGSVYLRANPAHKLPDLVADLRGPDSQPIEIELAGKTDAVKGALRNTFEAVPDAPVKKFTLELFGGKKGLIELSSGLCAHPRASVKLDAQSGVAYDISPKVKADCSKK